MNQQFIANLRINRVFQDYRDFLQILATLVLIETGNLNQYSAAASTTNAKSIVKKSNYKKSQCRIC